MGIKWNKFSYKHKPFFIFPQTNVSFLVYDRDVNWQGQSDDFMGSCNLQMTLVCYILPVHGLGSLSNKV